MRRRGWIIAGAVLLLLLGTFGLLAHRLLYTQAGLDFAIRQLDRLPGLRIDVSGARGTLAGPLDAERIVVDHEAVYLEASDVHVAMQSRALLAGTVHLRDFSIGQVSVRLKPRPERPKTAPHFLPAGLSIVAPSFRVGPAQVYTQGGQKIVGSRATGSLKLTRWRLDLDSLDVRGPQGLATGSLVLRATEPLGLRTNLHGEWRFPEDAYDYRFRIETRGKLDRLGAELYLDAPTQLSFSGTLLDLTGSPRARGTLRLVDFDGSPWLPPDRIPRLSGTVSLAAGRNGLGFDGTLTSASLPGQQVRLQGSGRYADADRAIEVASFRAWLPRTGLAFASSGRVELAPRDAPEGTLPRLALSGEWTALRWPLDERAEPVVLSPRGVYSIEGSAPYEVVARAEVQGAALPKVSFEATAAVDKNGLTLDRFDGYTLRGRIGARGKLQWIGAQRWAFDVDARSLAIHELRPGVNGTISARGTIAGAGLTASAPWTARLTSLSGTVFGRPLTGRGEVAHRSGVFDLRDVRIANGPSFVDVQGRVGAETLDLEWNLDLRSLAFVATGMNGQLVSRGTARGSPKRPRVQATARLQRFTFQGVTISGAAADVDVDGSDRHRSSVALTANYVATGVVDFDSIHAGLDGFLAEHDLLLAFASPGNPERKIAEFQGEVRAAGGFDVTQATWTGNLTQADVVFLDGEARLIQPAALTVGPGLQRSSPLCLRTADDARLCVEGEHRRAPRPSWRVIYSAQDWPLKRLLRTLLGWREFDGRLQASGWAEQEPGKPWVGGSTVLVHEPAFDMPRNKFRTERIQLGSSRVDLYVEPREMRAELNFEVDESTSLRGEAIVDRRGDVLASPVRGQVVGRSEAIKVLPLLVPEIDRAAGKLNGQVTIGGTLGQPEFTGDFALREGRLELYRTNLIVSALQADGSFAGDEFRFTAQGQTAKGNLTINGDFRWPQGVMTGSMRLRGEQLLVADTPEYRVLASPDIVLRAGPEGYRVEGEVLIPTARISPREFTSSVSTSPDERVVGLPDVEDDGPSTTRRMTSSVMVLLGESVRVEAYGLKARLAGDVTVSTVPDDVARGNGTIRVAEGEYRAFGQDVRITKGLLTYRNTPLSEPQLEIVAERKIKDTDITVAVNVRGTIDNPYIAITSTPSMPSNEALSYLLTGRSIDTLQSGEAANVNQAAESLAVSGGGLLLGGLGTRLGLDEVSLEKSGEDDTAVVLGKALSPKLFVSYGISIAEAINTIKLRYTLNDHWSIKAESGLEQSADFEYRIER
ncbi:MAG TPA: translocation/assembly module TamB domain-containing protein [Steroidobacteraceae bacterium]|nr:translocation/assembly module TamB domain-containing protein [Steroidobacteraceae bacterium]